MSLFIYEAYDKDGAQVRGEFEAATENEVVEHLFKRSLRPISIQTLRGVSRPGFWLPWFNRLPPVDILFLMRNLSTTTKAGMSIIESLDVLIKDTDRKQLLYILERVQGSVKNGQPLSKGFEPFRGLFPAAFIGMLRAGEISGELDKTFDELSQYLIKEFNLRQQIRAALIYPAVLLSVSVAVMGLLLIVVLPRLTKAFQSGSVELPLITKVFMGLSDALRFSFTLDAVVVGFVVWFILYFRKTAVGKRVWVNALSRFPVASDILKKIALVRFTRTLGNLVGRGVSAVEALELSADSVGNEIYAVSLRTSARSLERGVPLSKALGENAELFPRVLVSLVAVGEKTGQLGNVLLTLADFYEDEVSHRLKNLTAILEPALLFVMGLVVGAIALSILLPIYKLVGGVR